MSNLAPEKETLHVMLDILWKDLFHVRGQTWRTLELEVLLIIMLMVADLFLRRTWFTTFMAGVVGLTVLSGLKAAMHHRKTQLRTLSHIKHIEEELGLIRPGLIDNLSVPSEISYFDAFNPRQSSTPIFIMRMHFALLFICIGYPFASHYCSN